MDRLIILEKGKEALKKYRYVLLVLLAGLLLMCLPEKETAETPQISAETEAQQPDLGAQLEAILGRIQGAGKVKVLLTQDSGAETLYQSDEQNSVSESGSDTRLETVIITDADRGQQGLVRKVDSPVYRGAVIVCQGADSPAVRLAVVEAVSNATGLGTDKIAVLKME